MRLRASSSSGLVPGDFAMDSVSALTFAVSWVRIGRSSMVPGVSGRVFFAARLGFARLAAVFFLDLLRDFDTEDSSEKG